MLRSSVLLAVLACLPMAVACGKSGNADKQKKEEGESKAKTYYCPMHPDVTSDKPGTCSKCQMALKEKTKGDDSDSQANLRTYRCKWTGKTWTQPAAEKPSCKVEGCSMGVKCPHEVVK